MNYRSASILTDNAQVIYPTIIIDAGHGGEDGGASSSGGILEKDINLSIAKKVNDLLTLLGYHTVMIREDDRLIYDDSCETQRQKKVSDIHNRMEIMKKYPEGIFLSIHQNHFSQSKYTGAQVFYSKNDPQSKVIAQSIQDQIRAKLQPENSRKIKISGKEIYLLYNAVIPAVMVECGFLSNGGEALLLNDEEYQKKMSLAIAEGLIMYFQENNQERNEE
ncbi:MAG: N-acetylmuramoyl-L-alanine amidase [Acutalibacteraceae bacterium]